MKQKKEFSFLFYLQLVLAFFYTRYLCIKIQSATNGLSIGLEASFLISMVFLLWLTLTARTTDGSRDIDRPLAIIYGMWIVCMSIIVWFHVQHWSWDAFDRYFEELLFTSVSLAVMITLVIAKIYQYPIRDPYVKGALSIAFKSLPQLLIIPIIINKGIDGWSLVTIWIGHSTVTIRIAMIYLEMLKKGKNLGTSQERSKIHIAWYGGTREDKTKLVSEMINFLTWACFTIVYYAIKFNLV